MNAFMFIYIIVLFVILTPGQFIILPSGNQSKLVVSLTHGFIFALVYYFTHKIIWNMTKSSKESEKIYKS
jgi:amino acid permease